MTTARRTPLEKCQNCHTSTANALWDAVVTLLLGVDVLMTFEAYESEAAVIARAEKAASTNTHRGDIWVDETNP